MYTLLSLSALSGHSRFLPNMRTELHVLNLCARALRYSGAWPHLLVFIHPRHGEMDKQLSQEYLHSPGVDVHESRSRRGRVPEQMWAKCGEYTSAYVTSPRSWPIG